MKNKKHTQIVNEAYKLGLMGGLKAIYNPVLAKALKIKLGTVQYYIGTRRALLEKIFTLPEVLHEQEVILNMTNEELYKLRIQRLILDKLDNQINKVTTEKADQTNYEYILKSQLNKDF